MPVLNGGRAVIESLRAEGVRIVFGMPGTDTLPIYDSLLGSGIRHIVVRHEQAAVFMADAYSRVTGRPGVVILSTGPGAGSAIAAAQEAYGSSSPLLMIVSEIESSLVSRGLGALHEVKDQLGLFEKVTSWSKRITRVEDIPSSIHEAFKCFGTQRPRPIQIEIPTDLLDATEEVGVHCMEEYGREPGDPEKVRDAAGLLSQAKFPIIYAGGGVISADASSELRDLALKLGSPVLTSIKGKGAIPEDHSLSLGNLGPEQMILEKVLKRSDVALAVGTRFSNRSTGRWSLKLPNTLIQVDIDPTAIGKNERYPAKLGIIGDARKVLRQILVLLEGRAKVHSQPRKDEIQTLKGLALRGIEEHSPVEFQILKDIRGCLRRDAILANDSTIITYWTRRYFPVL